MAMVGMVLLVQLQEPLLLMPAAAVLAVEVLHPLQRALVVQAAAVLAVQLTSQEQMELTA
jgi:hypothetical protein